VLHSNTCIYRDAQVFTKTFESNVVGVLNVTRNFIPALEKRQRRLVVTITSAAGSNELMTKFQIRAIGASYLVSKAAVNMRKLRASDIDTIEGNER
jgi:NADP-dependent 3-hydroxy acid dehydrogenase YdfG